MSKYQQLSLRESRYVLSPKYEWQQYEIYKALDLVWKEGGWTVYIDELFYLTDKLKLGEMVDMLLTQGRSKHITVVCGMQRPVLITRFAISQSKHVISFGLEGRDIHTIGESTSPTYANVVGSLAFHQFAWYQRSERKIWVGKWQDLIAV